VPIPSKSPTPKLAGNALRGTCGAVRHSSNGASPKATSRECGSTHDPGLPPARFAPSRVIRPSSFARLCLKWIQCAPPTTRYTFTPWAVPGFILQHVVDAFAIQNANDNSKTIGVLFGLVGLYLHVENQFSGHGVQKAHMQLGRRKREWPRVYLPEDRGSMTVADVLAASAGPERDRRLRNGVDRCGPPLQPIARRSSTCCGNTRLLSPPPNTGIVRPNARQLVRKSRFG